MITNDEFERLMKIKKIFKSDIKLPVIGEDASYSLKSIDNRYEFDFDIGRSGKYELNAKLQQRYQLCICLFRLEVNSPPHINLNGERISRNHIHIYQEGYNLSWAYELDTFKDYKFNYIDFNNLFQDVCIFSNIVVSDNNQFQDVI